VKALAVVYCFPPLLVPAALCYFKLILGLRAIGVDVEVLAIDPRSFLAPGPGLMDESLNRVVPADLVQHQVWSPEASRLTGLLKRVIGSTPLGARFFEPRKREWTGPAIRRLRHLDLRQYDVVITCSQPHANHLVGLSLKKRTGMPWIAYFSDPWSRNPYAQYSSKWLAAHHRTLEAKVLKGADRVLFTSPEMLRLAEEDHGPDLQGKSGVLPHCFIPEWYGPSQERTPQHAPIRLLHTGHFYGPRSPEPLLRALGRIQKRQTLVGRLEIHNYGNMPASHLDMRAREGLGNIVHVHPVIPYLDSLALMRKHDALLLVDARSTQHSESVFLPSKLIDYLGSGTPVMAITPVPGCTARVVSECGGVACDIEKPEDIETALTQLLATRALPAPVPSAVQAFHYVEVARRLQAIMADVLDRSSSHRR
jgi:hypothetical protein